MKGKRERGAFARGAQAFPGRGDRDAHPGGKDPGERLGNFAQFAELKVTVAAFHGKLKAARGTQKGREGERDAASNDAEAARVALACVLYANVGRLMEKHCTEPHRIEDYFDLSLIRQTASEPTAPVPVATGATLHGDAANGSGAVTTLVTAVTPRTIGNGAREHAPV